jgi:hypothetical protein
VGGAARADRRAPYEAIADLIGVVLGGMPGRSTQTGRRFSAILGHRVASVVEAVYLLGDLPKARKRPDAILPNFAGFIPSSPAM